MKGTFFDNFVPRTDEEEESKKVTKDADADDIEDETGKAAEEMPYADEEEFEEEEEVEESKEKNKTDEEEETEEDDSPEPEEEVEDLDIEPLAEVINALADEGILYYDPEKEYPAGEEGFAEVVKETVDKKVSEWVEEIPDDYRSIIDHLKAGKPLEDWVAIKAPEDLENVDMDDEETQKALVTRHLTALGYEEEDIEEKLQKALDLDDLKAEAKIAQKYLVKQQKKAEKEYEANLQREIEEKQEREEQAKEALLESIQEVKELGGFKLNKSVQKQLFEHITKPVTRDGKTQLQMNQSDFKKQLFAAYLDMIDYKFDDLEKKAATGVSKGLRQALTNYTATGAKRTAGRTVTQPKPSARIPRGIWDSNREIED